MCVLFVWLAVPRDFRLWQHDCWKVRYFDEEQVLSTISKSWGDPIPRAVSFWRLPDGHVGTPLMTPASRRTQYTLSTFSSATLANILGSDFLLHIVTYCFSRIKSSSIDTSCQRLQSDVCQLRLCCEAGSSQGSEVERGLDPGQLQAKLYPCHRWIQTNIIRYNEAFWIYAL